MAIDLNGKVVRILRLPTTNYTGTPTQIVPAQHGDSNSRILKVQLYDDRGNIDLSSYSTAILQVETPLGEIVASNADISDDSIICELESKMLANSGRVVCNVILTGTDGGASKILTSQTFYVFVSRTAGLDSMLDNGDIITLVTLVDEVKALNELVDQSESGREGAEIVRVDNELQRQINELGENLEGNQGEDGGRVGTEKQRIVNENERQTAEETRKTSEETRTLNEVNRIDSEGTRELAEKDRVLAETIRTEHEDARIASENTRIENETTRQENESSRVFVESERVTAEENRELGFNTAIENIQNLLDLIDNPAPYIVRVTWEGDVGNFTFVLPASTHGKGTKPHIATFVDGEMQFFGTRIESSGDVVLTSFVNLENVDLVVR